MQAGLAIEAEKFDLKEEFRESQVSCASEKRKKKKRKKKKVGTDTSGLRIQELLVSELFVDMERIAMWWECYQVAFAKEHDWMEKKGQRTSRKMQMTSTQMLPLVFEGEKDSNFNRVCFYATKSKWTSSEMRPLSDSQDTSDSSNMICGYATVDENPDPSGVCHLRMLLVEPKFQRQGIGLSMLNYIVGCSRLSCRSIGLKYARCHNYTNFYEKVGFSVIGEDELYVYMALRR